jgi:hypothetical protein
MGCFGYICKGCKTSIRGDCNTGGERCILIHVRSGKEVGRTSGHYDEYGSVAEDKTFRTSELSLNSHDEICKSELFLPDSFRGEGKRCYKGVAVNRDQLYHAVIQTHKIKLKIEKDNARQDCRDSKITKKEMDGILDKLALRECELEVSVDIRKEVSELWEILPRAQGVIYSGIAAWHHKCYKETPEQQQDLTPSVSDPDQSWGRIRKEYS